MTQSIWRDEGFSYLMARQSLWDMLVATSRDFAPPLYYFLLHYWMRLFGSSEVSIRGLSFLFYLVIIYAAYMFLKNVFAITKWRLWGFLLLFAVNPFLIYFAFEARAYSLFALLTLTSLYYYFTKKRLSYYFFTIAGLYTHYFFIFVVLGQVLHASYEASGAFLKRFKFAAIPILLFLPWLVVAFPGLLRKAGSEFWILPQRFEDLILAPLMLYTAYERNFSFYDSYAFFASIGLFLVLVFAWRTRRKKRSVFTGLALTGIIVPAVLLLLSTVKPIVTPRYLIFASVSLVLLCIEVLSRMNTRMAAAIFLFLFILSIHYNVVQIHNRRKGDVRSTISEIKALSKAEDLLYITDPLLYFVAAYYFDDNRVYIYGEQALEIPFYIGDILIPSDKIVKSLPTYPRFAFVLESESDFSVQSAY